MPNAVGRPRQGAAPLRGESLTSETIGDVAGTVAPCRTSAAKIVPQLVVRSEESQPQRRRRPWHEQPPEDGRPAKVRSEVKSGAIRQLGWPFLDTSLKHYVKTHGQITLSLTSRINTRRPRDRSPAAERRLRSRSSATHATKHHAKVGRSTAPTGSAGSSADRPTPSRRHASRRPRESPFSISGRQWQIPWRAQW